MKIIAARWPSAAIILFAALQAVFAVPTLPTINTNNIVNIINFGAVSSTTLTNTTAIQAAINFATATNGGCTVEIPAGTYLSGPLTLKSKVNLQVDAGATLKMLPYTNWTGTTTFISGSSISDVEISGSGTIDGQGADWWAAFDASGISRPNFIQFSSSHRILIQGVTLQNPPTFHIMIKNNNDNITVRGITINTPGTSPNTDGFDIASTGVLIQDSYISDGDDNVEIGGSQACVDVTITNCTFGTGHGISCGSITSGGVSNITVINCSFNGTDYGIRLKSDNASSGSGAGGLCRNFSYSNITMSNIVKGPIIIYSYYNWFGTPTSITPQIAASTNAVVPPGNAVIWRDINFSNVTISASGLLAGIVWGRAEMPVTNVIFDHVNVTAARSFDVYHAKGVQFIDCNFQVSSPNSTFLMYDADVTVSNRSLAANLSTFDGLTSNGYGNILSFYNAGGAIKNTNALDDGPLSLSASTFTVSNNLTLFTNTVVNFALGTNTTKLAVVGNLVLGGTNNISSGAGFTNGTYTLMTYTGGLSGGSPVLGTQPAGYNYAYDTSSAGLVKLVVTPFVPPAPTNLLASATNLLVNLKWNAVGSAVSYNVKRGSVNNGPYPTTFSVGTTNYVDGAVSNALTYYYVVTAVNTGGESTNSTQVSAVPLPSRQPTNILAQAVGNQLQLSWPQSHLGWRLQIQTNNVATGIFTNWATVPNSTNVNVTNLVINPMNGSVFLRLVYP